MKRTGTSTGAASVMYAGSELPARSGGGFLFGDFSISVRGDRGGTSEAHVESGDGLRCTATKPPRSRSLGG